MFIISIEEKNLYVENYLGFSHYIWTTVNCICFVLCTYTIRT